MINPKLNKIFYGGDYNPDQWPREIWKEDMRLFKLAHIDIATLPVFSWALLQPKENQYDFQWLDEILDLLWKNRIYICLATSTAAHPAWMAKKYPDILRVNFHGQKRKFGFRHNSCPSSPAYRKFSGRLAGALARRYKNHPGLVAWHVSNEYGFNTGYCYCDNCAKAFRKWLKNRYGSLDELNARWCTAFWSHTFYAWDEIVPPNALSEYFTEDRNVFQGIALDYSRFMSDSLLDCYKIEYSVLKKITPAVPVTTNFMGFYKPLNYFAWAPHLDVISWDSYPSSTESFSNIALKHDLMRGLKHGKPFMLMEQTPSQTNWKPHNELKRPGVMRLWSWQAVAHGADTVMFFQLRRSRGASEKFHGAVITHCGHENTRVFREVAALGNELERLGGAVLDARLPARAAILFDWENWWALEGSAGPSIDLKYIPQIQKYHAAFSMQNIPVDIVGPDSDLKPYRVLVAPVAYLLQPGFGDKVARFVKSGGTFMTTFWSGIVDENDRAVLGGYPGELRKVTGIWAEEIDALLPGMRNEIVMKKSLGSLDGKYPCGLLCDLIHAETAEVLAVYGKDFYKGRPALTCNRLGKGKAWYIASDPEQPFIDELIHHICLENGIQGLMAPVPGVEVTERVKGKESFVFVLNHNAVETEVDLGSVAGKKLLNGKNLSGKTLMPGREVWIIKKGS